MLEDIRHEIQSTITPLLGSIVEDSQTLVRQEVALAKAEIKQEAAKGLRAGVTFAAAGGVGLIATILFSFMLVYFILWLSPSLPIWTAYGIVTIAYAMIAFWLMEVGKRAFSKVAFMPAATIQTIKENAEWAKQKI